MSATGRMSIEMLEAFVAVARSGNITQAGKMLNRTQPCISTQLKRLEERVGKPLLKRNARLMGLTQAGYILLENAENILQTYEITKLRLSAPELTGEVHVGLPEWFTTEKLQSVFYDFVLAHPMVNLKLSIADSVSLHEMLNSNKIDIAIALPPQNGEVPENFVEEQLIWVTQQKSLPLEDPVQLVLFQEPCPFRELVFECLTSVGRYWQERLTTSSVAAAQLAVTAGVGVSALPAGAVLKDFRILGGNDGFPKLPSVKLAVYSVSVRQSETIDFLNEHLTSFLHLSVNSNSALCGPVPVALKAG